MEYEIEPQEKLSFGLRDLWRYRELFFFFTWRDIKVKYKQTVLGFAWAVLQPFLLMLIFTWFFGDKMGTGISGASYPVFVYSGLVIWGIFSSGLAGSGNSMVSNAHIIKKIYFPRLIIPLSSVLVSLFDFLMTLIVFALLLAWYRQPVYLLHALLYIPAGILFAVFATIGPGMLLAALNVKYRDFRYIIPFIVQASLFLTPVIYPSAMYEHKLKLLLAVNPVSGAIELFRAGAVGGSVDTSLLLLSGASAAFFFLAGIFYFRKTESYFADIA